MPGYQDAVDLLVVDEARAVSRDNEPHHFSASTTLFKSATIPPASSRRHFVKRVNYSQPSVPPPLSLFRSLSSVRESGRVFVARGRETFMRRLSENVASRRGAVATTPSAALIKTSKGGKKALARGEAGCFFGCASLRA